MDWQETPYTIPLLVVGAGSVILALYMWRRRPAKTVTVIILACAEWMLGYALELGSADLQTKVFWAKVQYVGIVIVPTAWFAYILQYTGRSKWLTRRILALLSIVPTIILLLAFTNEVHGLIWTRVVLDTSGPFLLLDSARGVGLLVYLVYSYILLLLSAFLIIQMLIRSRYLYRWQASALLFGVFVPFLGSVLELFGLNLHPHLDLEPFGIIVTSLTAAFSVFYLRLGDVVPVAREVIIEGMSDGVIVLDAQNRIVDMNPAAQRLIGHAASEAIGKSIEQIWPEWFGNMESTRDMVEVAKEVVLDKGDGQRTCDVLISPLFDWRGRLISRIVVLRNITERKQMEEALRKAHDELEMRVEERTAELAKANEELRIDIIERKRAEEALRKSEEKYRTLFEESKDVVFISTPEGKLVDVNPAGVELLGYSSKEELLQVNTRDLYFNPDDIETIQRVIEQHGYVKDFELVLKRKDGQQIIVVITTNNVRDDKGAIVAYQGIIRDVTEQRQFEQQLFQNQKMASLGIMAGGVAHEIRNPLAVIDGASQLLEKSYVGDEFIQKSIKVIRDAVSRASEVVDNLLCFARREPKFSFELLSVNQVLEDTLSMLENRLNLQQIKILKNLADDLPFILGNANQLQQVIVNIILNAQSAMPKGGELTLETMHHNNQVVIKCSDTGEGISADDLPKIFDPFYTTKAPGQGVGLGLSISCQIVQQHDGIIEAHSAGKNCGSTFTINLPIYSNLRS
jgi:PAS domain S-box-containing protein